MSKRKLATKKALTTDEKRARFERKIDGWIGDEISIRHAYLTFRITQENRGNSKATLDFYDRFYKRLKNCLDMFDTDGSSDDLPVNWLEQEIAQRLFVKSLGDVNQQTINSYLRGYRAFGNFCEEQGFIIGFDCPIKEVEPPAKQVYSDKELQKLLIKPSLEDFEQFRNYTIISLILATGARANTILNIKISDVIQMGIILKTTIVIYQINSL